jgi:ribosomal protein S17E
MSSLASESSTSESEPQENIDLKQMEDLMINKLLPENLTQVFFKAKGLEKEKGEMYNVAMYLTPEDIYEVDKFAEQFKGDFDKAGELLQKYSDICQSPEEKKVIYFCKMILGTTIAGIRTNGGLKSMDAEVLRKVYHDLMDKQKASDYNAFVNSPMSIASIPRVVFTAKDHPNPLLSLEYPVTNKFRDTITSDYDVNKIPIDPLTGERISMLVPNLRLRSPESSNKVLKSSGVPLGAFMEYFLITNMQFTNYLNNLNHHINGREMLTLIMTRGNVVKFSDSKAFPMTDIETAWAQNLVANNLSYLSSLAQGKKFESKALMLITMPVNIMFFNDILSARVSFTHPDIGSSKVMFDTNRHWGDLANKFLEKLGYKKPN